MSTSGFKDLKPIVAGGDTGIPKHVNTTSDSNYDGPSMGWLIANKKLAHQIIATHQFRSNGDILDDEELGILRMYVVDPSPDGVEKLFRELGVWDEQTGKVDEENVKRSGSLVVHTIVKDGFDDESRELLRRWFESGDVDKTK